MSIAAPKLHTITAKLRTSRADSEVLLDGQRLKGCLGIWVDGDAESYPTVLLKLRADVDVDGVLPPGSIEYKLGGDENGLGADELAEGRINWAYHILAEYHAGKLEAGVFVHVAKQQIESLMESIDVIPGLTPLYQKLVSAAGSLRRAADTAERKDD